MIDYSQKRAIENYLALVLTLIHIVKPPWWIGVRFSRRSPSLLELCVEGKGAGDQKARMRAYDCKEKMHFLLCTQGNSQNGWPNIAVLAVTP